MVACSGWAVVEAAAAAADEGGSGAGAALTMLVGSSLVELLGER